LELGEDVTVLNGRESAEWDEAYIPQAKHLPLGLLEY
jgi:hypothetical protein